MFIWDFVADTVLGQIFDWIYGKIVEFLSEFLNMMNGMGSELFELIWVQAVVEFFHYFAWALYVVGLVVAVFEAAVEYQGGRTTAVRDLALGSVKGFLAVSLFTTVPVELYKLCIDLQGGAGPGLLDYAGHIPGGSCQRRCRHQEGHGAKGSCHRHKFFLHKGPPIHIAISGPGSGSSCRVWCCSSA